MAFLEFYNNLGKIIWNCHRDEIGFPDGGQIKWPTILLFWGENNA
jgi:hypothetical protein